MKNSCNHKAFNTRNGFAYFLCMLLPIMVYSQSEKKHIYDGNKSYDSKKYSEAEKNYRQALIKDKDSYKAAFNLGDAYYKQEKYDEAAEQFQLLTHKATSKDTLAKAYHNLGNALVKTKKYKESVDAYKNALKNNPTDEDTRYNLAYAQQMLKQEEQKNKDKENKEDKKEEDKKEEDKKNNENKDKQDKKDDNKDKQEQPKNQISKEDAQRLLDALQNDERKLQENKKAQKVKGQKVEIDKDW